MPGEADGVPVRLGTGVAACRREGLAKANAPAGKREVKGVPVLRACLRRGIHGPVALTPPTHHGGGALPDRDHRPARGGQAQSVTPPAPRHPTSTTGMANDEEIQRVIEDAKNFVLMYPRVATTKAINGRLTRIQVAGTSPSWPRQLCSSASTRRSTLWCAAWPTVNPPPAVPD